MPTACAGGYTHVRVFFFVVVVFFVTESRKRDEMKIRWVGLAEGTKERGEGTTGRGMNDEDNEWETQTGLQHMRILRQRGGWARAWEEGRRNSAACIAFSLIPATRSWEERGGALKSPWKCID